MPPEPEVQQYRELEIIVPDQHYDQCTTEQVLLGVPLLQEILVEEQMVQFIQLLCGQIFQQ